MAATERWYPLLSDALALHDGMMRGMAESPAPLMAEGSGKLESALARPRWAAQLQQADICEQAALLAMGSAQCHALADNNKRLAYIVTVVFLRRNGRPLPAEQAFVFAKHIEAAVERAETATSMGDWLRQVTAAS